MKIPPAPLLSNALVAFDGSGSLDTDPGDSVTSYSWVFRAVSAPCAPPTVTGKDPTAQVRFACPGTYAVDLTVLDALSYRSQPTTVTFEVLPYYGPALVEAGPDVVVDHACAGAPLLCAPTAPVALSATAPGATGTASFEWTARPPPGREGARVTFVPDRFSPSPTLSIETDGTAVSGEWLLEVVATDLAGVLGTAVTRVSVGNSPPLVGATVPMPFHTFDGGRFTATGEIPVSVSDPDGDPLPVREVAWHHSGDGTGSLFTGSDLVTRVTFAVVVPYSSPADAAFLIGGTGLARSVELAVEDVNGARTRELWPITVGNRPPVAVSGPPQLAVDHSYDPVDLAYEAVVPLSTWMDPDGDPLAQVGATGDGACPTVTVTGSGAAAVSCAAPFLGVPAVANLVGTHVVTQRIGDPWAQAAPSPVTFQILDRAPYFTTTTNATFIGGCHYNGACCTGIWPDCTREEATISARNGTVPSRFADPDGDPLDVRVGSAGVITPVQPLVCTPPQCDLVLQFATQYLCTTSYTDLPVTMSDGSASASGTLRVERRCT